MTLLLGLDIGTTSVKAGLFDETGARIAGAGREYALRHPLADRVEVDAETWWSAATATVRAVLASVSADPASVVAMAVSSQGESVVAVDAQGVPLAPAIVWLDNRASDEARDLAGRFDDALVYAHTGVPAVNPTWTAAKLLWWRRHEPELFGRASRFLLAEDVLLHRLTGRFVTEGGVQSTTLLYDIVAHDWWQPMLDAVGVDASRLPELVRPGDVVGTLTPAAAAALGLTTRTLVVAGGMDQGAGALGVGNVTSDLVSESTGGALTLQAAVDRHGADPTGRTPVYEHSVAGRYLYCPVCPTGGMALTWFRDAFGAAEVAQAAADGSDAYELLTAAAATVPPGADGLLMLPHLAGAFSPEYVPEARGVLFGMTLAHRRPHLVRAVLESVAFMLRRNLELMAGAGVTATHVRSHGGGARSRLWNQIKADVSGLPVVTLEGEDAAVRGDAMLAGVAAGVFPDLAAAEAAMVVLGDRYEPDPANRAVYDDAYGRYIALFDALRPLFRGSEAGPMSSIPTTAGEPAGRP